ncbi:hypothetical protein EVB32_029 [Rhizobium phage RHph_TM39]|uniref:Uncharacterized protein n=2 Tax=Cuauhnahuacvirus TaxID=3044696 RepID=A0A7S5R7L9_9CAUD|nr:hypothetical protein PQC16_gp029 [Rhizobium phage RHph_TM30]YP_010671178.1 hypothetical protein PQC17_gp029 [Rhizobium phage RHph_Y65]QIG71500.1 hypothetical protein EVB94_029 [Rhizobium phage RHph_TM40]QIG71863.1 hypothetical protein EVB95_029 [Rhizobium phage RHph_TM2_3B]QIG72225.1 hypothetical protein EVB96_029 [Rhizobium phage RHph_TM3_3_6]QIG77017.1 hypothetical protein EVB32_029 [Rhizobium phage RHph_TM39]QIG77357.1 hypothetical protein EVB61_029 [Rhizobium phage RHph_TM21B]QIG77616
MLEVLSFKLVATGIYYIRSRGTERVGSRFYDTSYVNESTANLLKDFLIKRWEECPIERITDLRDFFVIPHGHISFSSMTPKELFDSQFSRFKFGTSKMKRNVMKHLIGLYPDLK